MPGKIIKELRNKMKLTQTDLAIQLHTTQSLISRVEKNDDAVDIGFLKRVAAFFNVSVDSFFKDDFVVHRKEVEFTPPIIHKLCTVMRKHCTKNLWHNYKVKMNF